MDLTLADIGEAGLLSRIRAYCAAELIGDDAAVLDPVQGSLVVTTDALVEEVHFSDRTTPARSVGWRAAAANLSDLAAMGADPLALVISLGLPAHTPVAWVEELYQGIGACCQPWRIQVVGGDLCRAGQRFVAIAAWGRVEPERAIRRKLARPGDWLVATGAHGDARAGLEILLDPEQGKLLTDEQRQSLIRAHQFPQPRLDLLPLWAELKEERIGGMDTSDGLADALVQVCQASGVGAIIDPNGIPCSAALRAGFPGRALEWALYGGEDFELLLSLPPAAAESLLEKVPGSVAIGQVIASDHVELRGIGPLRCEQAFQHFG